MLSRSSFKWMLLKPLFPTVICYTFTFFFLYCFSTMRMASPTFSLLEHQVCDGETHQENIKNIPSLLNAGSPGLSQIHDFLFFKTATTTWFGWYLYNACLTMAVVYNLEHAESYNTTDFLHCSYLFSHCPPPKCHQISCWQMLSIWKHNTSQHCRVALFLVEIACFCQNPL